MSFRMIMRRFLLVALLNIAGISLAGASSDAEIALHALDYIGIDYPEAVKNGQVTNPEEYAEQLEFAQQVTRILNQQAPGKLAEQASELTRAIKGKLTANTIRELTRQISGGIIAQFNITTAPRKVPDPELGKALYAEQCVACHGLSGMGDGPQASVQTPPPTNFHNAARQSERTIFGLYSTITQGVGGTAMTAYSHLNPHQRWSLAFYVSQFVFNDEQRAQGERLWSDGKRYEGLSSMAELTRISPRAARLELGDEGMAQLSWLRSTPSAITAGSKSPLSIATSQLQASMEAYQSNNTVLAYQLALSSYLDGFELAESGLRAVDTPLVKSIEIKMLAYRAAVKISENNTTVTSLHNEIQQLLIQASDTLSTKKLNGQAAFVSAMVILLREGLEAILILAALASVLIKSGRRDALLYLHIGWISALLMGAATWYLASHVITISGASREITEGATALLATVVLLYVGFWLHGKTHAVRWQQYVRERIQKALHGGALWLLAGIAFLAVYREIFETVLFYQALYQQVETGASSSLSAGIATASVILLVMTWVILRTSLRLPLRLFFQVNSAIMLILAFTFAGHGIAALQEAGVIPISGVPLPEFSLLGIYPTWQSLLVQAGLLVLFVAYFLYERYTRPQATPEKSVHEMPASQR